MTCPAPFGWIKCPSGPGTTFDTIEEDDEDDDFVVVHGRFETVVLSLLVVFEIAVMVMFCR